MLKTLSVVSTLLIAAACQSAMVAQAKSEFNLAVEHCVNKVRLADGHTNQDIRRCLADTKGECAEPTGFISPFFEKMGREFQTRSLLTCSKTFEKNHEVCDISVWIKLEQAYSNINCIDIPKNS